MKKEIRAGLWGLSSIFIAVALLSHNGKDPGFFSNSIIFEAKNLCGLFGSYLTDFMFACMGIDVLLIPIILGKIAYDELKGKEAHLWGTIIISVLLLWGVSSVLSIDLNEVFVFNEIIPAGGIIGSITASFLIQFFNKSGAYLVTIGSLGLLLLSVKIGSDYNTRDYAIARFFKNLLMPFKLKNQPAFTIIDENIDKPANINKSKTAINIKDVQKNNKSKEKPSRGSQVHKKSDHYRLPSIDILKNFSNNERKINKDELMRKSKELEEILAAYKIEGRVVEVLPGPVITMYEFEPAHGIKVNQISNLADDIAMKLRAEAIRIIAPIPGKGAVGIEVPNKTREFVYFKDVYENDESWSDKKLPFVLGKTIDGEGFTTDLTQMPHLLLAGTTGSGKSVSVNAMICSILFTKTPDEVRLIMIDPKAIEFSSYENIPHLLLPIIIDAAKANFALKWVVNEMERRYRLMLELNVRKLESFNDKILALSKNEIQELNKKWYLRSNPEQELDEYPEVYKHLPYIVVVIDELADLMFVAAKEVEISIARLAQKARASGIHLLVATQRPSTDVITGLIKANFPSRIAFRVASKVDSRIILDTGGAESLLGHGDMLFVPPGTSRLNRVHGAFLSDEEVETIAKFWVNQASPEYISEDEIKRITTLESLGGEEKTDELFDRAVEIVAASGQASISMLQRKLSIGYNRSAKMIEMMEEKNMIGPSDGAKPREVYINSI